MTKEETSSYIKHHLTIAGREDTLFFDDAVELIHLTSRGLPRSVNSIAWQSLIAAFTEEKGIVDESYTRAAISETHATERAQSRHRVHDDPGGLTAAGVVSSRRIDNQHVAFMLIFSVAQQHRRRC
ncbi:hypothetical protein ACIPJK_31975 [Streptomyces roseus]|uniref:hypothetical protein n=1 Tax=Streptomyces roseus TaxID=66430 RepID=UPI003814B5D6